MPPELVLEPEPQTIAPDSLSDLVREYSEPQPRTEWVTRLNLTQPRERMTCLPLSTRVGKRILDIVGALTLLVVAGPIMIVAAILVKITSPGPIIYRQVRVGLNLRKKNRQDRRQESNGAPSGIERRVNDRRSTPKFGQEFTILKFRTMRLDAEKDGAQFAQAGDKRVTSVGRIFRKFRIDELPQLWNVLKGEMSLVGPRPERPDFMEELTTEIPNYVERLGLKPGLTGIAQVVNGYDNNLEGFRKKVSYDLLYLQNCCVVNDLKILLRTVRTVLSGDGAI